MEKIYQGYGQFQVARKWAYQLNMSRNEFESYMDRGLTVEELFKLKGLRPTKQRYGIQMVETQNRIYTLLLMSGYIEADGDRDCIEVERYGTNRNHLVKFKGEPIGVYSYKTGGLKLSGGEGLNLADLDWEMTKIRKNNLGLWEVHPQTRRIMVEMYGR